MLCNESGTAVESLQVDRDWCRGPFRRAIGGPRSGLGRLGVNDDLQPRARASTEGEELQFSRRRRDRDLFVVQERCLDCYELESWYYELDQEKDAAPERERRYRRC